MAENPDNNIGDSRWQRSRRRKRTREDMGLTVSDESEELDSSSHDSSPHQYVLHEDLQHSEIESDSGDDKNDHRNDDIPGDLNAAEPEPNALLPLPGIEARVEEENILIWNDDNQADDGIEPEAESEDNASEHGEDADALEVATSESDSEDDNDIGYGQDNELLYPGAPLTIQESLMSVLTLGIKHGLTGVCIADVLSLINIHCLPNNNCMQSLYKFKKYFSMIGQSSLICHYFCSGCVSNLETKESVCDYCQGESKTSFFIELPLQAQLQTMLKRPGFYTDLQHRFNRRKKNIDSIEDVYDGSVYKDQLEFLSSPNNISFTWYTDGVSIYKSSKFSIWPLYFVINELDYKKRTLKENVVLAGLWFGPKKPNPNVFLRPFHTSLSIFRNEGYEMEVANHANILLKGMLLCGVADLPAKSLMMRFRQYNGAFGCLNCTIPGTRYDLGNASVQVYPYSAVIQPRNNDDIPELARQAVELQERDPNAAVQGVKGPSLLYYLVPNMIKGTAIDKMHGVDSGVFKHVMSLLFDSSYSHERFSAYAMVDIVDERLRKIRPPSYVQRMPRSIKFDISLWKSSEYRLLLMIFSVPVFFGVVDEIYVRHHCLLVSAMYLLDQSSVSNEHITLASELLHKYVSEFETLYGLRFMSMNVHQLLHLPQMVRDNGPLWVYACYFYEDLNGQLAKLIHGTRHAGMQVCSAASAYLNLPVMIRALPDESQARKFCEDLICKEKCVKIANEISPGVFAVGTYVNHNVHDYNATALALQGLGINGGKRMYFHRLRKKGIMYYSTLYTRSVQKESSYVQVMNNDIPELGRIKYFVKWSECQVQCHATCVECQPVYFAMVELYQRVPWFIHNIPSVSLPHLNKVSPTNNCVLLPISALQSLCFYICVDDDEYITTPVNELEAD